MSPIRFIAGSGRSGTTWILDALASANRLRPVFEPLHPYLSEVGRRYAHRAVAADTEHPELKAFFVRVCSGHGPRLWTQYRYQLRWLFPPPARFRSWNDAGRTKRHWAKFLQEFPRMTVTGFRREPLIKCIRANLMLPWIANRLDRRVVLIVRHPGAVVESELRSGWSASFALDRFRDDATLREVTKDRYGSLLARKLQPVEALTLRWVVENQWVIEAATGQGIAVIHYEHLRSEAGSAWQDLCATLGLASIPNRETLIQPSQQSGARRETVQLELPQAPRWMSRLSAEQSSQVRGILEAVEFTGYTMDDPNPRESNSARRLTSITGAAR